MGRVTCWLVLAMSLACGEAHAAQSLTLAEALATAYNTNPQIEAARANARARDEDVAVARGAWRPSVNASGSYGAQRADIGGIGTSLGTAPTEARLSIQQSVITGGQATAQVSRAIAIVRSARAQLLDAEQRTL